MSWPQLTIDVSWAQWVIYALIGYYVLMWGMSLRPRPARDPRRRQGEASSPLMVFLVPARNEELVIDRTLSELARIGYRGQHRVLVIDDASTDETPRITDAWARHDERIRVLHRVAPNAQQGKSEALNAAYRELVGWLRAGDAWFAGSGAEDIVVVIVDADGILEPGTLDTVAEYFADPATGALQLGVRIGNAGANLLARMQDVEFVGFSAMTQVARDKIGSVALGGNGQFTRLATLAGLGDAPWRRGALSEDLDLGLRIVLAGWRIRFCASKFVIQQGVETWRPLVKQRTRWIQGHYQGWRYIPRILASRRIPLLARLDLTAYLVMVVSVLFVTFITVADVLVFAQLLAAGGLPAPSLWQVVGFAGNVVVSIAPLFVFFHAYQRAAAKPFRLRELPLIAIVFTAYGYLWFFVSITALWRLATGQNSWVKTPRVAVATDQLGPASPRPELSIPSAPTGDEDRVAVGAG